MEYLKGQTLKAYVRDHGPLPAPQALFIAQSVAGALVVVHSANVLHRDISPDNVILCENGDIKLIDFGAARQIIAEYSQNFSVILKPGFAPLEQYRKKGNQGPWTDVYSLGAMLYFMLTGDIPEDSMARFDADDTFGENRFELDPQLWQIISKAASLNVEDRYRDAYEMKQALDSVAIKPEPITVPSEGICEEPANFIKANGRTSSPITGKSISITVKQKNGFFKRHLRTIIEVLCCAAFTAVIILLAIKIYKPVDIPDSNNSSSDSSTTDDGNTSSVIPGREFETFAEIGYDKPFYSEMDDAEKRLYEMLYYGIRRGDESISVPSRKYTVEQLPSIYYRMMYDNPQFCDVQDFSYHFIDLNNNSNDEPDEYVASVEPTYIATEPEKMYEKAETFLDGLDRSDIIDCLRRAHDWLIDESDITNRYWTATCTYSYGAIIDQVADDLGFARAYCYLAQELGVYSYVTDEKFNGEQRAWCRLKIDGVWYNVDVYGDKIAGSAVKNVSIAESDEKFHTYFLVGDEFLFSNGYDATKEEGVLWLGDNGKPSPNENFYFNQLYGNYICGDSETIYNTVLDESAKHFKNGAESVSLPVAPFEVDELYEKTENSFVSDLEQKHGLTISGFTVEYTPDSFNISLKK